MTDRARVLLQKALATVNTGVRLARLTDFREEPCDDGDLFNRAGIAYYQLGRFPEATACFLRATELKPEFTGALVNLGACHNETGEQTQAIDCYRKALALDDNNPDAWSNLGKAYNDSGEFEMAVYSLVRAEALIEQAKKPRLLVSVLLGLARAYHQGGRDNKAKEVLKSAIELAPENPHAHHSLASIHFHFENFPRALEEFEWRLKLPSADIHRANLPGIFAKPACPDGRPGDKTLLLYTEQGFDDSIQFARFVRLLRPHVKRLVMWCRPGLADLFRHSLDVDEVSGDRNGLPDFYVHFPMLSIPRFYDPALESLGSFEPYLFAPGKADFDIGTGRTLNIGLAWGADKMGYDYANKTVPLDQLAPLLQLPGACWYSLQVGEESEDIDTLGLSRHIHSLNPRLETFAQTADAIARLDLVITTDTSVAHLAGAMGKPVWVMLKKNPDWRWDSGAESTPWYPSARLFRQHSHGDWHLAIHRIAEGIQQLIHFRANT